MARVLLAAQLRRTALILTILLATLQSSVATAAEYPSRVVSLVVAFPAGGGVDTVGRAIAQKLGEALGQQVIVVNRPGAGSVIGTRDVARAQPDGYTLLLLVTGAALPANPGYDLEKDFAPIGLIASVPIVIMSNPSLPAKSLAEVIALARKDGEKLTVGTPPAPTLNYFGAEQFKAMTGTRITIVTYKGTGPLTNDLVGGHVMLAFNTLPPGDRQYSIRCTARDRCRVALAHGRDSRCSDHCRSRAAGPRDRPVLRAGRAGGHAAADHRAAEPGAAQDREFG